MTIRTLANQTIPSAPSSATSASYAMWAWMNFMRQPSPVGPGWTVPRSSNGSVGGAGDNISTSATTGAQQLNVYSGSSARGWFVLRSPDGAKEWMVAKESTAGQYRYHYSRSASFTGGDEWAYPTAVDANYWHANVPSNSSWQGVLHCAADDASPYGFWLHANNAGVSLNTCTWGLMWAPMDLVTMPSDADPYWCYSDSYSNYGFTRAYIGNESQSYQANSAIKPGSTAGLYAVTAHYYRNDNNYFIPADAELTDLSQDVGLPVLVGRRAALGTGFVKGMTSFALWKGRPRGYGEMLSSRSRVVIGDMLLPWDGSSAFLLS